MSDIQELQDVIRQLHGADATHLESIRVTETFQGRTVWDGVVEVFELHGHPKAKKVYAWSHETDDPSNRRRHVAVLELHPVRTAQDAVRALIEMEFKNARREAAEEEG